MGTRDRAAQPIPLAELIKQLRQLQRAKGLEAARLARSLSATDGPTLVTLRAEGDRGLAEAKEKTGKTYQQLASELGYGSPVRVSDAVARHRKRTAG